MIDIKKLKLFPFIVKDIAFRLISKEAPYNVIFYPENSDFFKSYPKLNIRWMFIKRIFVAAAKALFLRKTMKVLLPYKKLFKLFPVDEIKKSGFRH